MMMGRETPANLAKITVPSICRSVLASICMDAGLTDGLKGCNIWMNRTRVGFASNHAAIELINCVITHNALCSNQHPEMSSAL